MAEVFKEKELRIFHALTIPGKATEEVISVWDGSKSVIKSKDLHIIMSPFYF